MLSEVLFKILILALFYPINFWLIRRCFCREGFTLSYPAWAAALLVCLLQAIGVVLGAGAMWLASSQLLSGDTVSQADAEAQLAYTLLMVYAGGLIGMVAAGLFVLLDIIRPVEEGFRKKRIAAASMIALLPVLLIIAASVVFTGISS